jgi:hypothetical protein
MAKAMDHFTAGRFGECREALSALADDFPRESAPGIAAAQIDALVGATDALLDCGRELLATHGPEAASAVVRASEKIAPADPRPKEILAEVKNLKKEQMSGIAAIRDLLGQGKLDEATKELDALGGIASRRADVAELAREAIRKRREASEKEHTDEASAIRQALDTARRLLTDGRPEAALGACQKAMRLDRHNEEARTLKSEIDAALRGEAEAQPLTDSASGEGSGS